MAISLIENAKHRMGYVMALAEITDPKFDHEASQTDIHTHAIRVEAAVAPYVSEIGRLTDRNMQLMFKEIPESKGINPEPIKEYEHNLALLERLRFVTMLIHEIASGEELPEI